MYWGAGSAFGFLTLLGYLSFVAGAYLAWLGRDDVFIWLEDEVHTIRRDLSRHTAIGPFYSPKKHSSFRYTPYNLARSFARIPRSRIGWGAILMFVGPMLVVVDFFV
jgi:hypothetical protein